ncbi:hypothetical protein SDC9_116271 [bioreactor metagenome]|uniref:Uncharacterized protein n=1 Tax=bioreactor metagenome TaxID=1076179 RepID=A0A645BV30_9ZZZZ
MLTKKGFKVAGTAITKSSVHSSIKSFFLSKVFITTLNKGASRNKPIYMFTYHEYESAVKLNIEYTAF